MAGSIHASQLRDTIDAELSASENEGEAALVTSNPEPWGEPFPIEWIITTALRFSLIRHLRNPWNGNVSALISLTSFRLTPTCQREVKLSNDRSELEIRVGERLLSLWTTNEAMGDKS
jgi:hypothetical protein